MRLLYRGLASSLECFSPVAGIQWVETVMGDSHGSDRDRFSPVAGIQWVETVSKKLQLLASHSCFSPVAGIQWVETRRVWRCQEIIRCFSPVAGIQWVETRKMIKRSSEWFVVSVPLPGFSGLRPR